MRLRRKYGVGLPVDCGAFHRLQGMQAEPAGQCVLGRSREDEDEDGDGDGDEDGDYVMISLTTFP